MWGSQLGLCLWVLMAMLTDLVSAPVPGGLDGESEHKARPRQISCDRIPKDVEGVRPRLVAFCADISRNGGNGVHVLPLEVFIASHLVES